MPLYLQNTSISGRRFLITKGVTCGSNVRSGEEGNVIFTNDSNTEFENSGRLLLTKNVMVEKGAKLIVRQSKIKY